ncbi:MAG: hypothetical protein ACRD01_10195 [Terriglobales bacterium]
MSTVRSIERRLYVRRQMDRDMASQAAVVGSENLRHMEWNGIWTGYMTFAGVAILLLSFVFGVGFSSLNPLSRSSWASVGGGTLAWAVVVLLISTFLGAWVAGRTPRTTKRHGMMRGITLWGMILLSVLLIIGWITGTAVSAASGAAPALGAAAGNGATRIEGVLQTNGITGVSNAQATTINTQLMAGDHAAAATTLAAAAGIPAARANTILNQVTTPVSGAATTAGEAVKHGAGSLSWGMFWIALIGLGCCLLGGAVGGGGFMIRRTRSPVTQGA